MLTSYVPRPGNDNAPEQVQSSAPLLVEKTAISVEEALAPSSIPTQKKYKKLKDKYEGLSYQGLFPVKAFKKQDRNEIKETNRPVILLPSLKELNTIFAYDEHNYKTIIPSEKNFELVKKYFDAYYFRELPDDEKLDYCELQYKLGKFYLHVMLSPGEAYSILKNLHHNLIANAMDSDFIDLTLLSIVETEYVLITTNPSGTESLIYDMHARETIKKELDRLAKGATTHRTFLHAYALYLHACILNSNRYPISHIVSEGMKELTLAIDIMSQYAINDFTTRAKIQYAILYSLISNDNATTVFYSIGNFDYNNPHYAEMAIECANYLLKRYEASQLEEDKAFAASCYSHAHKILQKLDLTNYNATQKRKNIQQTLRRLQGELREHHFFTALFNKISSTSSSATERLPNVNLSQSLNAFPNFYRPALHRVAANEIADEKNQQGQERAVSLFEPTLDFIYAVGQYYKEGFRDISDDIKFRLGYQSRPNAQSQLAIEEVKENNAAPIRQQMVEKHQSTIAFPGKNEEFEQRLATLDELKPLQKQFPAVSSMRFTLNKEGYLDHIAHIKHHRAAWKPGEVYDRVLELFKEIREYTMRHIQSEFCITVLEFCQSEVTDEDLGRVRGHLALAFLNRYVEANETQDPLVDYYLATAISYCDLVLKQFFYNKNMKTEPESVLRLCAFAFYVKALTQMHSGQIREATESAFKVGELYSIQQMHYDAVWGRAWSLYGLLLSNQKNPKYDPNLVFQEVQRRFLSSRCYTNAYSNALCFELLARFLESRITTPTSECNHFHLYDTDVYHQVVAYYHSAAESLVNDKFLRTDEATLFNRLANIDARLKQIKHAIYPTEINTIKINDSNRFSNLAADIPLVEDQPSLEFAPAPSTLPLIALNYDDIEEDDTDEKDIFDQLLEEIDQVTLQNPSVLEDDNELVDVPLDDEAKYEEKNDQVVVHQPTKIETNALIALNLYRTRYGTMNGNESSQPPKAYEPLDASLFPTMNEETLRHCARALRSSKP